MLWSQNVHFFLMNIKSHLLDAFDLLKKMIGQDNLSCTVFDFKTVSETRQKQIFLSHTELQRDNFLSSAQVV
jgi:hypothetical protein